MRATSLAAWLRRLSALSAAAAIAVVAACGDDGPSAEAYLEKGRAFIAENNLRAGVIELKNAIQKDPKSAEARLLLGTAHLKLGDAASAEKELTRALDLGAKREAVILPLADAWLAQGQFQKVLDDVAAHEAPTPDLKAAVHLARARAHFGLQEMEAGERDLEVARALAPDNPDVLTMQAGLAASEGDLDKAQALIEQAKKLAPDDPDVLTRAGAIASARNDLAQAVAEYQSLVTANPDNPIYPLSLAEARINNGEVEPAIDVLDAYLKRYPEQPYAHYLRGLAAYQKLDFTGAKEHAQLMVRAAPDHLPALLVLGGAHFGLGEDEQAINRLTTVAAQAPESVPARRMLGAALLRSGDPEKAREVLAPLEAQAADDARLLAMIGSAALRSGDMQGGRRYFERLAEMQPDNPAARAQLGAIKISLGEVEEGTIDLEKSIEQDPNLRSFIGLAVAHLRAGEFDKALDVAKRLSKEFPDSSAGEVLAGMAYMAKNEVTPAREAFERALAIDPGTMDASINLAVLKLRENDLEAAYEILTKALELNPENQMLLTRTADVEARLGRIDQSKDHMRDVIRLNPDAIEPKIVLANLHLRTNEPQKALDVAAGQLPLHPDNAALLEVVGNAYLASGQTDNAVETFERLIAAAPERATARKQLAVAYGQIGKNSEAKAQLEKALDLQPDDSLAKIGLARFAFLEGELDRADALVAELERSSVTDPRVAEIKGDIALQKNNPAAAAAAYADAFAKQPNTQRVVKLTRASRVAGDPGYRKTMDDWLAKHPDDAVARLSVATDETNLKRYDKARQDYEKVIEQQPDNVLALNNLAWILWRDGNAQAALPHAERALELAPNAPAVKDTAGLVHLKLGNTGRAVTLLSEAANGLPDNAEVQYHYAQALAAEGKSDEALDVLRGALSKGADFPERSEAEALLKRLGG
jgi:putative PEP-CTERM system TPR-repeat lipoprotein